MSYSNFTLKSIREQLGVSNKVKTLFDTVTPLEMSKDLEEDLKVAKMLPMRTEKARSELIVMPILIDLMKRNERFFTIYSGEVLNADKEKGLTGECDFILAHNIETFDINTPILTVVEAKKNDIEIGIPQCAAQMVGAKYFNDDAQENIDTIYGCVTTGDEWVFLKLQDNHITIDDKKYYLIEIKKVLGIFQMIIDYYKKKLDKQDKPNSSDSQLLKKVSISNHDLRMYPRSTHDIKRHIIILPEQGKKKETEYKVEIYVGKTMEVDCNKHTLIGKFTETRIDGWGYRYHDFQTTGCIRSTKVGCPPGSQREEFVKSESKLVNYNSQLPIVVYTPKEYTVKYKFWLRKSREYLAGKR